MNKESVAIRIQELEQQRDRCKGLIERFQTEFHQLSGALFENQNWLNALQQAEHQNELQKTKAKEEKKAKKLKSLKAGEKRGRKKKLSVVDTNTTENAA